jgi:hypothetical protein
LINPSTRQGIVTRDQVLISSLWEQNTTASVAVVVGAGLRAPILVGIGLMLILVLGVAGFEESVAISVVSGGVWL